MSTLRSLTTPDNEKFPGAIRNLEQLKIPYDENNVKIMYDRLVSLGEFCDKEVTPPGVKGFDLAVKTALILTRSQDHMSIPSLDEDGEAICRSHPFNIAVALGENPADSRNARAMQRGYRLGIFIIGVKSPKIKYHDSYVPLGEKKVLAEDVDSGSKLIGLHVNSETINGFNIGYGDGIFPANFKSAYSYTIETS